MSRSAHTYGIDDLEVVLTVPEGVRVPRELVLRSTGDDRELRVQHIGVKAVRSPAKRKPRQAAPLRQISPDFAPPADERDRAQAAAPSVDVDFETKQFVDWAISKGEARADWLAGWRRWIRQAHQYNVERGWKPTKTTQRNESPREKWCRQHGITVEEYEARKGDAAWLQMITRRGVVT